MTQLINAKKGTITKEMEIISKEENIAIKDLMTDIAKGETVIIKSKIHDCRPIGVGKNMKIKVNSNIGTSNYNTNICLEMKKLDVSIEHGADTVMDLSTGGDIDGMRTKIIEKSSVPIGTVPVYQSIVSKDIDEINEEDFLKGIKKHIDDGVDFITIHSGLRKEIIPLLKNRIMGVVSRGGSFLVKWMMHHKKENPFYSRFDDIIDMALENDVVLSLGDGLRPGCLADATDDAQIAELKVLGELGRRAREKGVQVIIEGPGHVPLDQIKKNIEMQKKYCDNAPFYVLGPLVTDISPGYDHISGAIGGALAATYGADFLCYLTPKEHLGLPDIEHVIDGVIASKIAGHAADIARGLPNAREQDDKMARARSELNWEDMHNLSLNPEKSRSLRNEHIDDTKDACSMCGDFCSAKINKSLKKDY